MRNRMTGKVGFEEDIAPLFSRRYCDKLSAPGDEPVDLKSWAEVRQRQQRILGRIQGADNGPQAPAQAWPQDKIEKFQDWVEEGAPKRRASRYADFFAELGSRTDYFDIAVLPESENLGAVFNKFVNQPPLYAWWEYAALPVGDKAGKEKLWNEVLLEIESSAAAEAILQADALWQRLVKAYFTNRDGSLDEMGLVEAFCEYGRDRLPRMPERLRKLKDAGLINDGRVCYAKYHRMESAAMWFNWAGHFELAAYLKGEADADFNVTHSLLAATAAGAAMDFLYRRRCRTKERYRTGGEAAILRQATRSLRNFLAARDEVHDLVQIFLNRDDLTPAMTAAAFELSLSQV